MTNLERIPVTSPASVAVFRRILTHGPVGRVEVARATGLSQAAVTKAVSPLIASGFIMLAEFDRTEASVGRPISPLMVSSDRAHIAGIKVTADRTYGVLTDLAAKTVAYKEESNRSSSIEDTLASIQTVVAALEAESPRGKLDGIGLAISGDVDRANGTVRDSPLLGWQNINLRERMSAFTDVPVAVENDVRALTISELMFGRGIDASSFAVVTIGTGIGCGLFVNGRILEGAHGVSGEIGHLPLASNELVCSCGRRGCVETVASSRAILDRVRVATGLPDLTMEDAALLAHQGQTDAVDSFGAAGNVIGAALAALANLVGPELIIIAGEGVTEYALYAERIRETFADHAFGAALDCEIVLRSHTFNEWARGAAVSVIEEIAAGSIYQRPFTDEAR